MGHNTQDIAVIVQKLTILGKEDFIKDSEEYYNRQIKTAAECILENDIRLIMLAGPSGSGKTTTAKKLRKKIAVMSNGGTVHQLSMDDWFRTASEYTLPVDEEGNPDHESPECLNMERLSSDMKKLFSGEEIELPCFDFTCKEMKESGRKLKLQPNDRVIIEGLHALNPMFTPPASTKCMRLYVSPADVTAPPDGRVIISGQFTRLCRRIYRDVATRGMTPEATIEKSRSVNRGERLYILPYINGADVMEIDTLLDYELFIHRKTLPEFEELKVIPLSKIGPEDIPEDSVLMEFYGDLKKQ